MKGQAGMNENISLRRDPAMLAAVAVLAVALLMVAGALIFEHVLGYQPCELCYLQRKPWYGLVPVGFVLVLFAAKGERALLRAGLALAGLILVVSAGLGVWHAGIEWKWWAGPASCTSSGMDFSVALPDLNKRVVLCDEAPLRILGLSLAGWNAVISALLAPLAFYGAWRAGKVEASAS